MTGPVAVLVADGDPIMIDGPVLSVSNVLDGPAERAPFPPLSAAVPAAIDIPRVPSPVMELMVTVREVKPDPDTPMVPVAFPI